MWTILFGRERTTWHFCLDLLYSASKWAPGKNRHLLSCQPPLFSTNTPVHHRTSQSPHGKIILFFVASIGNLNILFYDILRSGWTYTEHNIISWGQCEPTLSTTAKFVELHSVSSVSLDFLLSLKDFNSSSNGDLEASLDAQFVAKWGLTSYSCETGVFFLTQ